MYGDQSGLNKGEGGGSRLINRHQNLIKSAKDNIDQNYISKNFRKDTNQTPNDQPLIGAKNLLRSSIMT